jgi:hypothetical protein
MGFILEIILLVVCGLMLSVVAYKMYKGTLGSTTTASGVQELLTTLMVGGRKRRGRKSRD